jgi:biopolymer transport protein ExbB
MRIKYWGLFLLVLSLPHSAQAWWNGDWAYRKKISLNTSASGLETKSPLDQVPILVRLHSGNFPFLDAKEDGSDIRFVANDDKTPLKYHLELFDSANELALAWVQLPKLSPGATAEYIWIYFGHQGISAGDDAKATYAVSDTLVFHLNEKSGSPKDATAYSNNAAQSNAVLGTPGLIDGGASFNGSAKISLNASPSLSVAAANGFSFSAWVKPTAGQSSVLFEQAEGANRIVVGFDADKPYAEVSAGSAPARAAAATALTGGKWHHIAITWKDRLVLYVDGAEAGSAAVAAVNMAGGVSIGDSAAGGSGYKGDLDEVKLANVARSPDWIRAAALSQGLEAKLLTFGEDEQRGGGGSSYLAILLRAVTLDGWIVISILGVMAFISWYVMAAKARTIGQMHKGNVAFQSQFQKLSGELRSVGEDAQPASAQQQAGKLQPSPAKPETKVTGAGVEHSPLYRIYRLGVQELKRRFDGTQKGEESKLLSAQSIDAIKASLDAGLVRETHRLNKQMVMLTIAISGGPFLGLLGTVVGVMITFAAIAASGDVNVNSIAPGIAAALVATVAGLAVAIPALFGYNYLNSRIRDLTAEMQVFTDEFITKVAETYSK